MAAPRARLAHRRGRAAALDVLPPDLVALLTAPPHALRLTPRALDTWIRDLEAL